MESALIEAIKSDQGREKAKSFLKSLFSSTAEAKIRDQVYKEGLPKRMYWGGRMAYESMLFPPLLLGVILCLFVGSVLCFPEFRPDASLLDLMLLRVYAVLLIVFGVMSGIGIYFMHKDKWDQSPLYQRWRLRTFEGMALCGLMHLLSVCAQIILLDSPPQHPPVSKDSPAQETLRQDR